MSNAIKFYCDDALHDAIVELHAVGKARGWSDEFIASAVDDFLRDERTKYHIAMSKQQAEKTPKPVLTVVKQ